MTKQNQKKCIFCRKEGFPILPVRYSLAPYVDCDHLIKAGKNCTPDIKTAGNFEVDGPAIGNTKANYTLRLLRAGFLYLYNEKTKTLSLYYVSGGSDEGYLKGTYYVQIREFSQNDSEEETESKCQPTPGITALDGAVCEGACTQARASYITVPKDSAVIWLTFSDAMWPKEIVKACLNNEASFNGAKKSFREEYMRKFDVKAWKESQDALHTATIDKLGEVVTEYYRDAVSNLSTIWLGTEMATPAKTDRNDWPTFTERFNCQVCKKEPRANTFLKYVPYNTLVYDSKKLDDMLAEAKKLSVDAPGAIVALDDPVGVLLYLSNLMSWLVAKCASGRWTSMLPADTDFGWKQFTATSLDGLKSKVITDAYINRALELYFDREIEKLKQSPPSTLEVMTAVDDLGRIINQKVMDDWSAKQKKIRQLKQERNDISSGKTPFDRKEMADKIGLSEEQLDNICIDVAEKTWKDYSKYLDESEVDGFKKDFQRVMSNFKKTVVEKFGRLYVDWLTSDFLYRYFNGNYSQIETEKSGSAMSLIFYNCISTISENSSACLDQIELWHEKDPDGEEPSRNLLLRAYLNNNKELISDFSGFGVVVDERNDSEDEEVSSSKLGKEYDNN